MKIRRLTVALLVVSMLSTVFASADAPNLRINNYVVDFTEDQGVELVNGEVYIPLRKVGELCHFEILWENGTAIIKGDNINCVITPDSDKVIKNGIEGKLVLKAFIQNGRTLIGVEDAKELFDLKDDILRIDEAEIALHQTFVYNEDKFYNLITSFIGDPKTMRGFSWEAELDFDDMVLEYKKENDSDDNLIEIAPTCEKQMVTWANNKTYDEVPLTVYDCGNRARAAYRDASMHDYKLFYKANVEGLESGTKYQYRIGSKSKNVYSEFYTFETEAEDTQAFSIIGVTDPQGRTVDEYNYYKLTLDKAFEDCTNPAFVLNCGDFTDNAYYDDWWRYFFEASKGTCEGIPLITAVGNHEERGYGVKQYNYRFNNPQNGIGLADNFVATETTDRHALPNIENLDNTVYSFDYGNTHFAVINSGTDFGDSTDVLALQKEWLKNDLQSSEKKWKVLVTHRGVYVEKVRNEAPKNVLLDVIDECGVDLVIEGHDHTYMRTHIMKNDAVAEKGTVYALIGSAAKKRYEEIEMHPWVEVVKPLPDELPNYVTISFDNDKISYTAKLTDGTVIDSFEIAK